MSVDFSVPARTSMLRLLLVYIGYLILGTVVVAVIYFVAEQFLTNSPQNSAMGVLVPMIAAMGVTSFWAKREGRPASGRQWGFALLAAIVTIALNLLLLWVLVSRGFLPELGSIGMPSGEDLNIALIICGVAALVVFLVLRLGLWLGFNGWHKQQAKLAAKNRKPL